jgi:hypothetical protein
VTNENVRITIQPERGLGGAMWWTWTMRLGIDVFEEGQEPTSGAAAAAAFEAMRRAGARALLDVQPQITHEGGRWDVDAIPGVTTCAFEGCGEPPARDARYGQCEDHEAEARHAQGGGE